MLRTFSPWRLRAIGWFLAVAFLLCAGRLYYLHIIANPKFHQISENNRIRLESRPAKRGEITDCNGELIATHQTRIVIGLDSQDIEEKDKPKLPQLARLLEIPYATVQEAVNSDKRWVKLKEGVNESAYKAIEDLKIKGVYGYPSYDRVYPKGNMAAHVIGFLNKEGVPTFGVEKMMDFYLKGQDGWRETELDGRKRELGQFRSREVPPQDGLNVELTIDIRVQAELEDQMKAIVDQYHPDGASIIVSDPKTGFILGMCNSPSFDPNNYAKYPIENFRNRAISDMLEPGSTFKIVPIAAAFEEKIITPDTVFDCGAATAMYRGKELPLPKNDEKMGMLSVRDIIAKSSNKGASQIGMKLGEEKLYAYAAAFGYGRAPGTGLMGEGGGMLLQLKHWDGLTITRMPMGHAIAGTPLQIHYAISTLANDGVLMQPQIIRRVYDDEGHTVLEFKPRPRRQVISPSTAQLMAKLLIRTVSPEGTAPKAQIAGYEVAGKTGTTQKLIDGHYSNTHHIASFSGFFPSRDPKLDITVIVDNPHLKGIGFGGQVSAPVFKAIATRLIQHLAIAPVPPSPEATADLTGKETKK
jgi:cell division protein FtsI/penicillin-binding protein 2